MQLRKKQGVICKKCGGEKHYWLPRSNFSALNAGLEPPYEAAQSWIQADWVA